jgi:serine/threonine protein kinase
MRVDDFVGKQVGDFQVQERIGRGAMAVVYRAFQPSVNRHVALKIIQLNADQVLTQQDDFRRRFAQEAELIARLEHLHILPVYDYGIEGDIAFLAMRWLRGGTLTGLLDGEQSLSFEHTAHLISQIASGLTYAHGKGVIHRSSRATSCSMKRATLTYPISGWPS